MKKPSCFEVAPKGGFAVTFPTGITIASLYDSEFLRNCKLHMEENVMPYPFNTSGGWQDRMWHQCCIQNPDMKCADSDRPERSIGADDILRYARTMWVTLTQGGETVSQEEQDRRVDICLKCPKIGVVSCFIGCNTITEALSGFILGRSIRRINEVHKQSCMACGCPIEVKSLWPISVLKQVDNDLGLTPDYNRSCWMIEGDPPPAPEVYVDPATSHDLQNVVGE